MIGSLTGGHIGRLIHKPTPGAMLHPAGFITSIVGAIVVLILWALIR